MAAAAMTGATVVSIAAPKVHTLSNISLRTKFSSRNPSARVSNYYSLSSSFFLSNPKKLFASNSKKLVLSNPNKRRSIYRTSIVAKLTVGKRLPEATLSYFNKRGKLLTTTVTELTRRNKLFMWTVNSQEGLKRFVKFAEKFKADGLYTVVIVEGNDADVVREWKKGLEVSNDIPLLVDAEARFTTAMGAALGPSEKPAVLGIYSENGIVKFSPIRGVYE